MGMEATTVIARSAQKATVSQSVQSLAEALRGTPEFQALMEAARGINTDDAVQDLLRQMRVHQSAFQLGRGNQVDHLAALRQLRTELDARASVQAYHQAEQAVRALFRTVDTIISEAAGVDFAANAKRSCCG